MRGGSPLPTSWHLVGHRARSSGAGGEESCELGLGDGQGLRSVPASEEGSDSLSAVAPTGCRTQADGGLGAAVNSGPWSQAPRPRD